MADVSGFRIKPGQGGRLPSEPKMSGASRSVQTQRFPQISSLDQETRWHFAQPLIFESRVRIILVSSSNDDIFVS